MRRAVWLILGLAGCGSVTSTPGDAPVIDTPLVDERPPPPPPNTPRWVRSLASLQALGVADGPGGLVVTGSLTAP
ncbi:MAG: hypothetical protein H7138_05855, partial [Myxococcales bacterium]|nr:hypothetical protein [Myxococcales bacterium]